MQAILLAAVAGVVQGVVEWLPVSSKTMITLIFAAGGYSFGQAYVMGLLANFGSFFAALWFFRRDVASALWGLRRPLAQADDARLLRFIVLATVATGIVGVPVYAAVSGAFSATTGQVAMVAIGALLLVTSGVNMWRERLAKGAGSARRPAGQVPGPVVSLVVGACQGFAAFPGISRSASTVTPLLLSGFEVGEALRLSFVLDVVALLGAGIVPLVTGSGGLKAVAGVGWAPVAVMLAVSAVVSFLTIGGVLRLAARLRGSIVTLAIGLVTIAAALVLPH